MGSVGESGSILLAVSSSRREAVRASGRVLWAGFADQFWPGLGGIRVSNRVTSINPDRGFVCPKQILAMIHFGSTSSHHRTAGPITRPNGHFIRPASQLTTAIVSLRHLVLNVLPILSIIQLQLSALKETVRTDHRPPLVP